MSETTGATDPEPTEEIWAYGGLRLGAKDGKPYHAWVPDRGRVDDVDDLWYPAKNRGDRFIVGALYRATVRRRPREGGAAGEMTTTLISTPIFEAGSVEDRKRRAVWEATDAAAKARQARARAERKAGTDSALDDALAPLVKIARTMRTNADRDAFAALVLRRLSREW